MRLKESVGDLDSPTGLIFYQAQASINFVIRNMTTMYDRMIYNRHAGNISAIYHGDEDNV